MDKILESPVPSDIDQVLREASVVSVIEDYNGQQQELTERYPPPPKKKTLKLFLISYFIRLEDYLDVVRLSGDSEAIYSLGTSLTQTANNILISNPQRDTVDGVYGLIEDLESVLLCDLECGEPPRQFTVFFFFFFFFEKKPSYLSFSEQPHSIGSVNKRS